MELRHDAGQPITPQHLRRHHIDASVAADLHRIERRSVGTGVRQSLEPVRLIAECLMDLFDAALVLGGHVPVDQCGTGQKDVTARGQFVIGGVPVAEEVPLAPRPRAVARRLITCETT